MASLSEEPAKLDEVSPMEVDPPIETEATGELPGDGDVSEVDVGLHLTKDDLNPNIDDVMKVFTDLGADFAPSVPSGGGGKGQEGHSAASSNPSTVSAKMVDSMTSVQDVAQVVDKVTLADEKYLQLQARQTRLEERYEAITRRVNLLRCQRWGAHIVEEISRLHTYCEKTVNESANGPTPITRPPPQINPFMPIKASMPEGVVLPSEPLTSGPSGSALPSPAVVEVKEEVNTDVEAETESTDNFAERQKAEEVIGQMQSNFKHLVTNYDSDATESSSGGESCDEFDNFSKSANHYLPVKKRAKWTWLSNRATIASKWTWLTAQISDLEYRIRQQTEFYRQIRAAKGAVQLGDPPVVSWPPHAKKPVLPANPSPAEIPMSLKPVTKDYSRIDSTGRKIIIKEPSTPESAANSPVKAAEEEDNSLGACRTRPLKPIRKRRILSTKGLHRTSARAAKEASVQCDCLLPNFWCAICLGRREHTQVPDPLTQEAGHCMALLDHSYHQVLSTPQDVSLSLLMTKKVKDKSWLAPKERKGADGAALKQEAEKACVSLLKKKKKRKLKGEGEEGEVGGQNEALAKLNKKKKLRKKNLLKAKMLKRRKSLTVAHMMDERMLAMHDLNSDSDMLDNSPVPSPLSGGGPLHNASHQQWAEHIRRKRETAYDIDNIVIPYSIAAATRVEKIKYKEIITPTWREQEKKEEEKKEKAKEPTEEDISETLFEIRHARAEVEERRRWHSSIMKASGAQRSRTRRQDSVRNEGGAASSGYNTPDHPMSPGTPLDATLEVATRPSTPTDIESSLSAVTAASAPATPQIGIAASIRNRRRTSSATKSRDRNPSEDTQSSRCTTPTSALDPPLNAAPQVAPYEPRTFPLSDAEFEKMEKERSPAPPPAPAPRKRAGSTGANTAKSSATASPKILSRASSIEAEEEADEDEETDGLVEPEDDPDWNEDDDDPEWDGKEGGNGGSGMPGGGGGNPGKPGGSVAGQKNKHGLSLKIVNKK